MGNSITGGLARLIAANPRPVCRAQANLDCDLHCASLRAGEVRDA